MRKPRNARAYHLEVPKSLRPFSSDAVDERGELVYSELDLDEAVQAAVARGREEATQEYATYREELHRGCERVFDIVEDSARQLQQARDDATREIGEAILDLTYRLVERIVRVELPRSRETLPRLLDELMAKLSDVGRVVVRVSPVDYQHLQELKGTASDRWKGFEFRSDDEIEEGGCLLETETGCWDARVESQLKEIRAEISRVAGEGVDESEAAA